MLRDIRFAVRTLLKNRLSTLLVVLVLALGIAAGTVVFSAVRSVLLFPVVFAHPEELVMLCETDPHSPMDPISYPNFLDWRRQSQAFAELAAYRFWNFNLRSGETAVHVPGAWVSTNYFRVWQLAPVIGRTFAAEYRGASAPPEVVVSYGFWQRRFGGDKRILGRTLALDEIAYTVIGVMPPSFSSAPAEVWVPIDFHADRLMDRGEHLDLFAYGRMKPGIGIEQAQSEMDTIARRLAKEFAGVDTDVGVKLTRPGEWAAGPIRPTLLILSGSVAAVALLVFANVSCLMLARAGARRNETAVRAALGASRWQTARPFVAESMLGAVAGGCLGALLARAIPTRLLALAYLRDGRGDIEVSGATLALAVLLAAAGGLLWGVIPLIVSLIRGTPRDAGGPLKESTRTTAGSWWLNRFAGFLVVADIALALALMFVASLLARGYAHLQSANPGINPDKLLTMQVALPQARYSSGAGVTAFYRQLLERTRNIPGVESAAAASFLPLSGYWAYTPLLVAGRGYAVHDPVIDYLTVSPGYFHTLGIPILKGRSFSEADDARAAMVAIVDEIAARVYWPGRDPLGTRLRINTWKPEISWLTVVGIVGRVQHYALDRDAGPLLYLPFAQDPQLEMRLAVRTIVEPRSLAETVVRELRPLNRDQAAFNIGTMEESLSQRMAVRRFTTAMLGALALVALAVAAVGVFGVLSYAVGQRTQEIGIRMALGAQPFAVRRMVVGEGMRLVFRGLAIGAVLAAPAADLLSNLIFGLKAGDLPVLAGVAAVLILAALLACYLPARRASTVDPMVALRHH
jgi:putative ABC transport system permease protein